jgi:hypothetical protein
MASTGSQVHAEQLSPADVELHHAVPRNWKEDAAIGDLLANQGTAPGDWAAPRGPSGHAWAIDRGSRFGAGMPKSAPSPWGPVRDPAHAQAGTLQVAGGSGSIGASCGVWTCGAYMVRCGNRNRTSQGQERAQRRCKGRGRCCTGRDLPGDILVIPTTARRCCRR